MKNRKVDGVDPEHGGKTNCLIDNYITNNFFHFMSTTNNVFSYLKSYLKKELAIVLSYMFFLSSVSRH